MKTLRIFLISIISFFVPFFVFAATNNVFSFATYNDSLAILENTSGDRLGYDGVNIFEEINNSEVFLNGDFLALKINDIVDGEYKIKLENSNQIYEKTLFSFNSAGQFINQRVYFFLDKKNQISFSVSSGKVELGENYSIVQHLRLKKTPEWKLSWKDDNTSKFKIYGKKDGENDFKYIAQVDAKEYILTGSDKNYKEYSVTKVLNNSPYSESGIFPNVLGATVSVDDIDEDGIADQWEDVLGTDKESADTDNDGIDDAEEILEVGTDPNNDDTDNDGKKDGEELAAGTDPNKNDVSSGKSGPKKFKKEKKDDKKITTEEEKNQTEDKKEEENLEKEKKDDTQKSENKDGFIFKQSNSALSFNNVLPQKTKNTKGLKSEDGKIVVRGIEEASGGDKQDKKAQGHQDCHLLWVFLWHV